MSIPQLPNSFLTPKDLQERLKIGRQKANDYSKQMDHYRVGRLIRFTEESLQKWLEERKIKPLEFP